MDINEKFFFLIDYYKDSIVGKESYANETEFYDEDGSVLFIIKYDMVNNKLIFKFSDYEDPIDFEIINEQEFNNINKEFFNSNKFYILNEIDYNE